MTLQALLTLAQTIAIIVVGIMEGLLIRELRETRRFLQRINDNVLGAVGANMALNTAIAFISVLLTGKDRGKE
jgi:hypothetical protein